MSNNYHRFGYVYVKHLFILYFISLNVDRFLQFTASSVNKFH